ncbi:hypothetical protein KKA03_03150 [archaeon]|nr:hypothetical protein [archaeon]
MNNEDKAEIVVLRGLGYTQEEIANKIGVTKEAVSYHLGKFKDRANEVGVNRAYSEIMLLAGPNFALQNVLKTIFSLE